MKKLFLIAAFVALAVVSMGALGGNYVWFNDKTDWYLTAGGPIDGLLDTSDVLVFPEDLKTVTWYPDCDSGAADADDDTVAFLLYGVNPWGSYTFLDTIGEGDYCDAAVDSTEKPVIMRDTLWHYHTVQTDSVAATDNTLKTHGQGWLDRFTQFLVIMVCTDSTDLGVGLKYVYTTYTDSKLPGY